MFKLCVLFGDGLELNEISQDEFECLEVPLGIVMDPIQANAVWEERKKKIAADSKLPIPVASHFIHANGFAGCGPTADWDQIEFWVRRGLERCGQLGVKIAGIYGMFFPLEDEKDRARAEDETMRFLSISDRYARENGVTLMLEPMAKLNTVFPRYLDGLRIMNMFGSKNVRVMADIDYFLELDQPLSDIKADPAACLHVHIAGDGAQPNIGSREKTLIELFTILREIGYEGAVSCACPWQPTKEGPMDKLYETKKTAEYLQNLRAQVYAR